MYYFARNSDLTKQQLKENYDISSNLIAIVFFLLNIVDVS